MPPRTPRPIPARPPRRRPGRRLLACAATWLVAALAWAGPPAAVAPTEARAHDSFAHFSQEWMAKIQRLEVRERQNPTIRPGARAPRVTYRGYGDEFSTELRSTGHPEAPFVGLLRYTELLYRCTDATAEVCTVASSTPVTEIFRLRDGRWVY